MPPSPAFCLVCAEPVTGRERELTDLERVYEEGSRAARGNFAFITGEAGIGKTTDRRDPASRKRGSPAQALCCSPANASSAVAPESRTCRCSRPLGRLARQPSGRTSSVPLLARQAPTWLAQMPWLLADDELEAVQRRLVGATPLRMLREIVETLELIGQEMTLVFVLEDLHWSGASTISIFSTRSPGEGSRPDCSCSARTGAARRSRSSTRSTRLVRELRPRGLCTEIAVGPLSQNAVADYARVRLGADASPEVSRQRCATVRAVTRHS